MPLPYMLWAAVLTLGAGASAYHRNREADVFFHLELGRAVLEHGARTVPEPYAMPGFEPECMAPAWLWDVIAYALQGVGGFFALSVFTVLCAMLAGLGIAAFTRAAQPAGFVPWALVSAAALTCAAMRFQMRPQTLAIAVLAGYLALSFRHVAHAGRRRAVSGGGLVALAVLWAQLHGSFVLAPVVFAIVAIARRLGQERDHARDRVDLLTLAGTTAALGSSAAGLDLAAYIGSHGYGDAVRFIHEMRPPRWVELVSLATPSSRALVLLWGLSAFGLTRDGRWQWGPIALALVGHVMLSRAVRFVAEDALLSAPLALAGAQNLALWARREFARRVLPACSVAPIALGAVLLGQAVHQKLGGYGVRAALGLDETAFPRLASRYLERLARGSAVLSSFEAGPPLGFWSQGRIRTYVDGRTPLYFDDADYALQREILTHEEALDRGLARFGFRAAVVVRAHGVCDLLNKRWTPVVIEAAYTTFVPPSSGEAPLSGLEACGPVYVHPPRAAANLAALDRSLARLGRLGGGPFLDYLRAERLLLGAAPDTARVQALLDRAAAPQYASAHRRARVSATLTQGEVDAAYDLIHGGLREGDVSLLQFVVRPELGAIDSARARALLELAVAALGEAAGPPVRSLLAAICVQQGDAACARFHALRAAARAAPNVEPTLSWLSQHAETERERADARAWLEFLQNERRTTTAR